MARLTEAAFLADLARDPGGHCRKPHYWLKKDTRTIYAIVWKAWWRGYCTVPLFNLHITEAGRRALAEQEKGE